MTISFGQQNMTLNTWPTKYFTQVSITFFLLGSYISAASISCERFYAVFWPFKHRSLSTRTYRITIFSIWTFAVLLSTLITLLYVSSSFESSLYVFVPVVLGLTVIICVCNIAIWRNFQRERVAAQHRNGASRNRRLTKTLLLMSTLALVCWLPLITLNILINMTKTSIPSKFYLMVNILNYSNSFVFDAEFMRYSIKMCCRWRQRDHEIITTTIERKKSPKIDRLRKKLVWAGGGLGSDH